MRQGHRTSDPDSAPQGRDVSSRGRNPIGVNLRCEDLESRGAAPESSPRRKPWDRVRRSYSQPRKGRQMRRRNLCRPSGAEITAGCPSIPRLTPWATLWRPSGPVLMGIRLHIAITLGVKLTPMGFRPRLLNGLPCGEHPAARPRPRSPGARASHAKPTIPVAIRNRRF